MWRSREGKDSVERKEDIDVFTYTFVLPLVMLVSEHREGVVEEKIFPASVCDCITLCLGVFCFVSPPITRRRYSPFNHSRFVKNCMLPFIIWMWLLPS